MEVSEAEEIWICYSYLTGPCISMREDITKSINQHLGSLLYTIIVSPIVTHFTSPQGNAEGSFILRYGANRS